ncbi:hypothetical protein HYPSUDRAFT_199150 [Hypholoma sublateritium FD-334 SS-4]|uniref:Uncharacterized protein n=1 Tax=Hypholoma sublateritium (strain FD-334 SS-4) TaxID=945553 RepID=A0A0D2LFJ6_HYPSF|nr:hypothetical protein HYPSUDRAFT_199150 [Hypholoma sublateritium FD-334 SS-4]
MHPPRAPTSPPPPSTSQCTHARGIPRARAPISDVHIPPAHARPSQPHPARRPSPYCAMHHPVPLVALHPPDAPRPTYAAPPASSPPPPPGRQAPARSHARPPRAPGRASPSAVPQEAVWALQALTHTLPLVPAQLPPSHARTASLHQTSTPTHARRSALRQTIHANARHV